MPILATRKWCGFPVVLSAWEWTTTTPSKLRLMAVWCARIVLATVDGYGTNAIMRLTGKPRLCVWRGQKRYVAASKRSKPGTNRQVRSTRLDG